MQEKNNKYCCEDHTDMAFDDFILENETFPYIDYCTEESICTYCNKKAIYVLKKCAKDGMSELL